MEPEEDDYQRGSTPRSVFSTRWFRAVLVAIVLVLAMIIALPYILDQFTPAPTRPQAPALKAPEAEPKKQPVQKIEAPPPQQPGPAVSSPQSSVAPSASVPPTTAATEGRTVAPSAPKVSAPEREDATRKSTAPRKSGSRGGYLVQVGAFQESANAAKLAAKLTAENYPVRRMAVTRSSPAGYEVVVLGATPAEVNDRLRGESWRGEAGQGGTVIRPPLSLKDAVALSQTLRAEGFRVKIRRTEGAATVHVVWVGEFPDRAGAEAVRRELKEKGHDGFIVRGDSR